MAKLIAFSHSKPRDSANPDRKPHSLTRSSGVLPSAVCHFNFLASHVVMSPISFSTYVFRSYSFFNSYHTGSIFMIIILRMETSKTFVYFCKKCDINFESSEELSKHLIDPEHKFKEMKCGICDEIFNNKSTLERHIHYVHKRSQFKCKDCDKSFTYSPMLLKHQRVEHEQL